MAQKMMTRDALAARLEAEANEAWAASHHVCPTCGGIVETEAAAAVCVKRGNEPAEGPYHHTRTQAQTARKVRNATWIARGMAAERADRLFRDL